MDDESRAWKIERVRKWADHLGLRLRRRGSSYSIHDGSCRVNFRRAGQRVDFQKQNQIAPWLEKYMEREIARLAQLNAK